MSSARLLLVSLLVLTAATPSRAAFHHALIDELMSGAAGNPAIQFVEMRMIASGQIQTNGSRLVTFNCDGTVVTTLLVVSGNISNGGVDRRWLMASPDGTTFLAAAGISADFTWNPAVTGSIPTACGQVCWGKPPATGLGDPDNYRDCVAYGAYTGPLPTGAGPPSSSTPGDGTMSLTRGGPDRFDNAFFLTCPSPTNDADQQGDFGPCTPGTTTSTSTTTSTTIAAGTSQLLSGKLLLLTDNLDTSMRKVKAMSKDVEIDLGAGNLTADDPVTTAGSTLRVVSAAGDTFDATYPLPKPQWAYIGAAGANLGYRYVDPLRVNGPVTAVLVKRGVLVKVAGKGTGLGHSLGGNPDPVAVVLQIGSRRYCTRFGGTVIFDTGKKYLAKDAPAPGLCPP